MKKITTVIVLTILLPACVTIVTWFKPSGFTYLYDGKYTGLDTLINVDGYFYSDSINLVLLLYDDGTIGRTSLGAMERYRNVKGNDVINTPMFSWGVYRLKADTIMSQTVLYYGGAESMRTSFETYVIRSDSEIELYSENKNVCSTKQDILKMPLYYQPYSNKPDSAHWIKNRRWFWNKEVYKEWKRANK